MMRGGCGNVDCVFALGFVGFGLIAVDLMNIANVSERQWVNVFESDCYCRVLWHFLKLCYQLLDCVHFQSPLLIYSPSHNATGWGLVVSRRWAWDWERRGGG